MGFLKAIWRIIMKIVKAIVNVIKKYWWIILILVAIWFAPAVAAYLASSGAPAWLTTTFSWIGANLTPTLTTIGGYVWQGVQAVGSGASAVWDGLSPGTKAALVVGATALIAPEETADALAALGDLTGDLLGVAAGAFLTSPVGLVIAGFGLWWLLGSHGKKKEPESTPEGDLAASAAS